MRHYGLLANGGRAENLALMRELLAVAAPTPEEKDNAADVQAAPDALIHPCPCCGGRMFIIGSFDGVCPPRRWPSSISIRIDTS